MMQFRWHRGSLDDSMATVRCVRDLPHLLDVIETEFQGVPQVTGENIRIEHYGFDKRIGWDSHVVYLPGYGVIGFTDGPLPCP